MNVTLTRPRISGAVKAIPSKSHAHRLLICASLSDGVTRLYCPQTNEDIDATVRCLTAMGAKISHDGEWFTVEPVQTSAVTEKTAILDCGESGSTLRFLLPVVAALGISAEFHMSGRLPYRPLSPLRQVLAEHGVSLSEEGKSPLTVSGKLKAGKFSFDGGITSQFTTGLLLALPLLNEKSVIELTGKIESRPYIDLTVAAMAEFGVEPEICQNKFLQKPAKYTTPKQLTVEGDWSNGAFMLCIGALSDDGVTVIGLNKNSVQGDCRIIDILASFGADCTADGDKITVKRKQLRGVEIDASHIPDLVPVLSCVAAGASGTTVIRNCGRLRIKESDRLTSVSEMLNGLGADVKIMGDTLVIDGKEMLEGGVVDSYNDHRIVMSAAVASCLCKNSVTICGAEAVGKSYPAFFADLEKISK